MGTTKFVAEPGKQEIVMSRIFAAPRDRVFDAYVDPQAIAQWWGPRSMTTTAETLEARQGGLWRFVQRDAAGHEFAFRGVFHESLAPERQVKTFEYEGMPGHVLLETLTFEEAEGGTRVTSRAVFQSLEARDGMLRTGAERGAAETWDRLEELLKT